MIEIIGGQLTQWDVSRSVKVTGSTATHIHLANRGDAKAVIMRLESSEAKIPDYLLQTGKLLVAYAVLDGVTIETQSFSVRKREKPDYYVYEDDTRNYIYDLIREAEEAIEKANNASGGGGGTGKDGKDGKDGATFTPSVDPSGNISWTNDAGLPNPETMNIRGPKGDDGKDGKDGKDGSTPVKGVDYFTEEEKDALLDEMKEEQLSTIAVDFSDLSNGTWTETLSDGTVVNHTVTFDDNGNPTAIDGMTIEWPEVV